MAPIVLVTHRVVSTHGQGRINLEAARHFAVRGLPVVLVCEEADADIRACEGVQTRLIRKTSTPTDLLANMAFSRAAASKVRRLRREIADSIVISNGAATSTPADINIAMFVHAAWWRSPMHPRHHRGASAGRLWTAYQTLYTRFNMRAERKAFRSARVCIGLADIVRDELIHDAGVDPARAVTILPGVDCEEFRPAEPEEANAFRRSVGAPLNAIAALFAGDIRTNRKNLDLVLQAIAQLPGEVELWVAGSTDGSPYPAMAERLGIGARVRWLGHRTDMPKVMRAADFFVFPSHYEPFGLVVLEALASGLPAIVSRQTGASDAVRGEAGLILDDASDSAPILDRVRAWIADRARLAAAKRVARGEAQLRTWSAMGEQYLHLIDRVRAERSAQVP